MNKNLYFALLVLLASLLAGSACSRTDLRMARSDGAQPTGSTADAAGFADAASADGGRSDRGTEAISPSLCGNGLFDRGEECDDGNTLDGDGCSSQCKLECDWMCDCHPWDPPCVALPVCGDGLRTSGEECDDGNTVSGDGCSESCEQEPGWTCVPGSRCYPTCGDGRLVGWETCDDGNTQDGDGCASDCLAEACWDCSAGPCTHQACPDGGADAGEAELCGDGIVEPGEQCDNGDGNSDTTYGTCTTRCTFGPYCGDGMVNGPEECDLGRANGTVVGKDGCTLGCTRTHYCGDGVVDVVLGEECDLGDLNGVPLDSTGKPSPPTQPGTILCSTYCRILVPTN